MSGVDTTTEEELRALIVTCDQCKRVVGNTRASGRSRRRPHPRIHWFVFKTMTDWVAGCRACGGPTATYAEATG